MFPHVIEKAVYNSVIQRRDAKTTHEQVIECKPEFRTIFEQEHSIIGKFGPAMQQLLRDHKPPKQKKERKKFKLIL